jgi:HEAT repeat protein
LQSLDAEINAARTDQGKASRIAADLLAQLARPDDTVAARQALCERLGWLLPLQKEVSVPKSWAPLVQMLDEPANVDFARLALERVPGAAVDALFVEALQKARSASASERKLERSLIMSIAVRRIASAVPALTPLLSDAETSSLAAYALGAIGTQPALDALLAPNPADKAAVASAIVAVVTHTDADGHDRISPDKALQVAQNLSAAQDVPVGVRGAALEFVLSHRRPEEAIAEMVEVLRGSDWPMKEIAAGQIVTNRAPGLTERMAREMAAFDAPTQVAVIAALGRRGDVAATDAIIGALSHADASVRLAAIEALAALPGSRASAEALLKLIAANTAIEETKAARLGLARMSGREPDAAIVPAARGSDPKLQVTAIEQLALRNVQDALPLLRELRSAQDASVRSAAGAALGDIGPISDQPLLISWALQTTDDDERSRVLRGLVTLTQRIHRDDRAKPIWQALESAPPAVVIRALPVLARLGDTGSANCAARLALRPDPAVAAAAANTLSRWSDTSALDAQVSVAVKAPDAAVRRTAFNAAVNAMDRAADPWTPTRSEAVAELAKTSPTDAEAASLLRLLRRASDAKAQQVARALGGKPALSAAARECDEVIQVNRTQRLKVTTSGGWGVADMTDGRIATGWSVTATPGQWVQIDFGQARPVTRLILDQGSRAENAPGTLEVFVTDDPHQPGNVVTTQPGQQRRTIVELPAGSRGRYVILKNSTERIDGYWSIAELVVE